MVEIPEGVRRLLERPVLVTLGTVRPDGAPQVNPMWFVWDGEFIWFTHTNVRQKYKNFAHEPRVSIAIFDPEEKYGYVEIRGVVDHIDPDPEAKLYQRLSERYDGTPVTPRDAADRVAVAVRPTWTYSQ
ncbi:PPOX class probable F420-dependent enzyme [Streptomyces sp. 846.5]|nr:PPOX class F420-dependent oxidoreductase [Streptomyces sp. 846.5]TDU03331.1 PPOX class probable F420-dependent enzyme [Streptomyces sp. 846.5]